jgi:nitronate monooxygenase
VLHQWRDREAELETDEHARADLRTRAEHGDLSVVPIWAGEATDLITGLAPAAELVATIAAEAEAALRRAAPAVHSP